MYERIAAELRLNPNKASSRIPIECRYRQEVGAPADVDAIAEGYRALDRDRRLEGLRLGRQTRREVARAAVLNAYREQFAILGREPTAGDLCWAKVFVKTKRGRSKELGIRSIQRNLRVLRAAHQLSFPEPPR